MAGLAVLSVQQVPPLALLLLQVLAALAAPSSFFSSFSFEDPSLQLAGLVRLTHDKFHSDTMLYNWGLSPL